MLRYLSAGESHGKGLVAIIEGLPSNMDIDVEKLDSLLEERQQGYGRSERMNIEKDKVEIISGTRGGRTLGSPLCLVVYNRDWENWKEFMDPIKETVEGRTVTRPRPGHADLAGALKYNHRDIRNVLERASARETAIRTAVGGVALQLIERVGISVLTCVTRVAGVDLESSALSQNIEYKRVVQKAREKCDTIGGIVEIVVTGVPPGLGSYVHYDRKIDGKLAAALMSIQGIKGVEIGLGFEAAHLYGSEVHDEIFYDSEEGYYRKSNRTGGIEGGVTNGSPIVLRCAMKPIPTLGKSLASVDMITKEQTKAASERSDICAVKPVALVAKAAVAWVLAAEVMEKVGGDTIDELENNYKAYLEYLKTK